MVTVEEFVKVSPVAARYARSLRHIAVGRLQQLDEILLLKLPTGFIERWDFSLVLLYGIMQKVFGNKR